MTDGRAKQLEVRGQKKTVSHLINGLNLIRGGEAQIRQCVVWSGPRSLPAKLQNGKKVGWPGKADLLPSGRSNWQVQEEVKQAGEAPASW